MTERRRALSEISSPNETHKRRRNSLGFQMVKITSPPKMNQRGSFIPVLKQDPEPRGLTQRLSFENAENETSGFSFPLSRERDAPKTDISGHNADKYRRLLTINHSLNLKTRIPNDRKTLPSVGVHEDETAYTEELARENETLSHEVAAADLELALVEEETLQFRLLYKALRTELHELQKTILDSEGRFEFLLNQITSKVERREHEMNQKLQKLRVERDGFLRDSKFEVENEVKAKLENEDTEVVDARERMQAELASVHAEMDALLRQKQEEIDAERKRNEAEIVELVEKAREDPFLEDKREKLAHVSRILELLTAEVENLQETQRKVDIAIKNAENSVEKHQKEFQSYDSLELQLLAQISSENRSLKELLALLENVENRFREAKKQFQVQDETYQKYHANRRSLEFLIMCYEENFDFLVIPESYSLHVQNYKNVSFGETSREFSKVVLCGDRNPLLVSASEVFLEWQLLVQESAMISSSNSIFLRCYGKTPERVLDGLSKKGPVSFQSVVFKDGVLVDLLGNSVDVVDGKVVSEKKELQGADLEGVLLSEGPSFQIYSTQSCTIYVAQFSIPDGTFLDETERQLLDILHGITKDSTVVNVCDLSEETSELALRKACQFCDYKC